MTCGVRSRVSDVIEHDDFDGVFIEFECYLPSNGLVFKIQLYEDKRKGILAAVEAGHHRLREELLSLVRHMSLETTKETDEGVQIIPG